MAVRGGHAAREAVLDHRRHRLDDLESSAQGVDADHAPVHARPRTSTPRRRTCRRRSPPPQRQLPPDMPTPPSFQKVNPADQPILFLALSSPTLPLYDRERVRRDDAGAAHLDDHRRRAGRIFGSQKYAVRVQLDPSALATRGIGIDEVRRRWPNGNVNLPTGTLYGPNQAFTVQATGQLHQRRRVPAAHRRLPQRRARAPRASSAASSTASRTTRSRAWFKDERARHARHPAAARHQHGRGGGRDQALLPAFRAAAARPRSTSTSSTTARRPSATRSTTCKFTLLLAARAGGAGDLPLPAQPLGHASSRASRCRSRSSARSR